MNHPVMNTEIEIVSRNGDSFVSSLQIAEGIGNEHSSVLKIIRNNIDDFNDFGLLDFKSESTAGRPTEYALLNEQQATLLMTYFRNNETVKAFKKNLVKVFYAMRDRLATAPAAKPAELSRMELLRLALEAEQEKILLEESNRQLSDNIKAKDKTIERFIETADNQNLINAGKILGLMPRKFVDWLKIKYMYYQNSCLVPYQEYVNKGLFVLNSVPVMHSDGVHYTYQAMITPKGIAYFSDLITKGKVCVPSAVMELKKNTQDMLTMA